MNQEQKDLEDLQAMFAMPGWKLFVEDARVYEETLCRAAPNYADTNDKWQYARGEIAQLRRIIGYEDFVVASAEQDAQDAGDVIEGVFSNADSV